MLQPIDLLDWASSPSHLQYNRYVKSGYRPLLSTWGCLQSLFYVHNELFNVYSHGLFALYFMFIVPMQVPWSGITQPLFVYLSCMSAVTVLLGSFCYHLFMNHHGGAPVYSKLLQCDMIGIGVLNLFGPIGCLFVNFYPWGRYCYAILIIYTAVTTRALFKSVTAKDARGRAVPFIPMMLFRGVLLVLRMCGFGSASHAALWHMVAGEIAGVTGAVINILRVPERWLPGRLSDYLLNSHCIHHVCAVTAILNLHWATMEDILWFAN
ncbi:progestin and adipoQ receptor family member 4-like [Saccoglossus kowalevskii]